MVILLVRGEVRPDSRDEFDDAARRYNSAREAAGLPVYRRLVETTSGELVFMCEFADEGDVERTEQLLETDPTLKEAVAAMYEHILPGSVTATTLRDVD